MLRYGRTTVLLTQRTMEELKFSNTMEWITYIDNNKPAEILKKVDPDVLEQLHLPPPPRNDSVTTSMEIQELLLKKKERNKQNQDDIENEKSGEYMMGLITDDKSMLYDLNDFIRPYILHFKKKFDRVRPRILEPQIEPTIDPPGHPAYPSGHATQMYSFALYMSHLFPQNKEKFMRIADRVATNRELAGVHYSSDTEAGHQLAMQLVPIFIESSKK